MIYYNGKKSLGAVAVIGGEGGGGTPTNMVTTNTNQVITGKKTFIEPIVVTDSAEPAEATTAKIYGSGIEMSSGEFLDFANMVKGYKWSETWNNTAIAVKMNTGYGKIVALIEDQYNGYFDHYEQVVYAKQFGASYININAYGAANSINCVYFAYDLQASDIGEPMVCTYYREPEYLDFYDVVYLVKE